MHQLNLTQAQWAQLVEDNPPVTPLSEIWWGIDTITVEGKPEPLFLRTREERQRNVEVKV